MMNPNSTIDGTRERQEQLAQWLRCLIETLRQSGGETWKALVQILSGKTAAIALDGVRLQIAVEGGDRRELFFEYAVLPDAIDFRTDADTLRAIVAGQVTVDGAVLEGRIYACNELDELLSAYEVVMRILADSAIDPELQDLWMEFDESWPSSTREGRLSFLEGQKLSSGYLIQNVPEDVLAIEIEPYLADDRQ
ncbi:MAG: hypothetical protein SVX43_18365 [Cyanobacteriota bacterium]|nr:hypothetical protein [Cyanobacteriota bacterium]